MRSILIFFFLLCVAYNSVKSEIRNQKVILAVGQTGLGKSFTATLFGFNAKVGHTSNSTTKDITIYNDNKNYVYIDTPGFDDSDVKVKDGETVVNILSKMQEESITEVHAVFWFVNENSRATQSLQMQAKFIESLSSNNKAGNIWNNVIVVYKGPKLTFKRTVIEDAIKMNNRNADPSKTHFMPVQLHSEIPPDCDESHQGKDVLRKKGIYKKEDLSSVYKDIIQDDHYAKNPIRVVFKDDTCVKCRIKGDRRLNKNTPCHTEAKQRHDKDEDDNDLIESYKVDTGGYNHPGSLVTVGDEGWEIARDVVRAIPIVDLFQFIPEIGVAATQRKIWSCCGRDPYSQGCTSITTDKQRHTCCRKDKGAPGCKKVCASCGKAWGNSEGCFPHEKHQYLD